MRGGAGKRRHDYRGWQEGKAMREGRNEDAERADTHDISKTATHEHASHYEVSNNIIKLHEYNRDELSYKSVKRSSHS